MSQRFRWFLRLPVVYRGPDRERYGYNELAIVVIDKIPYEQKYVDQGEKGFSYISKYEWRMVIDLWVVILRFNWIGREQDAKA